MTEVEMKVRPIKIGTVIDHIAAGQALNVLKILGIHGTSDASVSVVMNVESGKLGKKDIVKVEDRELKEEEVNRIALIAPAATINIIRDYSVTSMKYPIVIMKPVSGQNQSMDSNSWEEEKTLWRRTACTCWAMLT